VPAPRHGPRDGRGPGGLDRCGHLAVRKAGEKSSGTGLQSGKLRL
ncbi:MAG: hypothetical protein AVDCRST_MAG55-949, partial [uncultured Rubrobacteraceae bacterium]